MHAKRNVITCCCGRCRCSSGGQPQPPAQLTAQRWPAHWHAQRAGHQLIADCLQAAGRLVGAGRHKAGHHPAPDRLQPAGRHSVAGRQRAGRRPAADSTQAARQQAVMGRQRAGRHPAVDSLQAAGRQRILMRRQPWKTCQLAGVQVRRAMMEAAAGFQLRARTPGGASASPATRSDRWSGAQFRHGHVVAHTARTSLPVFCPALRAGSLDCLSSLLFCWAAQECRARLTGTHAASIQMK